jgi:hypothetical protein
MTRQFAVTVALVSLGLAAFMLPAQSKPPGKAAQPKGPPITNAQEETAAIMHLLQQPIETKQFQEKIKLKTALEVIADKFGGKLPILVDKEAFAAVLGADAADPYEEEVVLPPVPSKMVMGTALRLILSQVGQGQATFVIRKGYIEIVTEKRNTSAYFLYQPCILAIFQKRPVPEVLQELSNQTGLTIHLDPNIGDKANTLISATFRNCSLEDALVTVTEMAQLKYVVYERSIFVTTPDRAKVLEKEERIRNKKRKPASKVPNKWLEAAAK